MVLGVEGVLMRRSWYDIIVDESCCSRMSVIDRIEGGVDGIECNRLW